MWAAKGGHKDLMILFKKWKRTSNNPLIRYQKKR